MGGRAAGRGEHVLVVDRDVRQPAAGLLTIEIPSTSAPRCLAAIASMTVDMPTRSAPAPRIIRISAGVSKCGPGTPA